MAGVADEDARKWAIMAQPAQHGMERGKISAKRTVMSRNGCQKKALATDHEVHLRQDVHREPWTMIARKRDDDHGLAPTRT